MASTTCAHCGKRIAARSKYTAPICAPCHRRSRAVRRALEDAERGTPALRMLAWLVGQVGVGLVCDETGADRQQIETWILTGNVPESAFAGLARGAAALEARIANAAHDSRVRRPFWARVRAEDLR